MPKLKLDNASSLAHIQEPPMLISEILPEGSITCVYASKFVGKTFFALEAARAVAFGLPFMGHFPVENPGNVIFIEQDSPIYDTGRALYAMLKEDIHTLEAQVDGSYHLNALGISWHPGLKLHLKPDCSTIANTARQRYTSLGHHGPVERAYIGTKLIILDTLRRFSGQAVENDNTQMGVIMDQIDWIRENGQALGGPKPAVLFLHHSTKTGFSARGGSVIESEVDNLFQLSKNKRTGVVTCRVEKARAIQPPTFKYQIETSQHRVHGTLKKVKFAGLINDAAANETPPATSHQMLQFVTNRDTPCPRADLHDWGSLNGITKQIVNKWVRDFKTEGKLKVSKGCIQTT